MSKTPSAHRPSARPRGEMAGFSRARAAQANARGGAHTVGAGRGGDIFSLGSAQYTASAGGRTSIGWPVLSGPPGSYSGGTAGGRAPGARRGARLGRRGGEWRKWGACRRWRRGSGSPRSPRGGWRGWSGRRSGSRGRRSARGTRRPCVGGRTRSTRPGHSSCCGAWRAWARPSGLGASSSRGSRPWPPWTTRPASTTGNASGCSTTRASSTPSPLACARRAATGATTWRTAPPGSGWSTSGRTGSACGLPRAGRWRRAPGPVQRRVPGRAAAAARAPWLGGRRLRAWLERHRPLVERIAAAPDNPAIRRWWPRPTVDAILRLWRERDAFCAALEGLPQAFGHGDAIRRNLLIRRGADGSEELVGIDWEHAGCYAAGEEVGQTLSVASAFYDVDPADLPALDEALFANYLAGLRDAGWRGDPRRVRFAYAAHAALRNLFNAVGASVPDEAGARRPGRTTAIPGRNWPNAGPRCAPSSSRARTRRARCWRTSPPAPLLRGEGVGRARPHAFSQGRYQRHPRQRTTAQ